MYSGALLMTATAIRCFRKPQPQKQDARSYFYMHHSDDQLFRLDGRPTVGTHGSNAVLVDTFYNPHNHLQAPWARQHKGPWNMMKERQDEATTPGPEYDDTPDLDILHLGTTNLTSALWNERVYLSRKAHIAASQEHCLHEAQRKSFKALARQKKAKGLREDHSTLRQEGWMLGLESSPWKG